MKIKQERMMEENQKKDGFVAKEDVFSRSVRAGKRTYYIDVKTTRKNDYYLTITERKKRYDQEGVLHVEKHKVFLYREDFEKFSESLAEVIDFIKKEESGQNKNEVTNQKPGENNESSVKIIDEPGEIDKFTDVDFDDLDV